jgi:hypothetical protein
MIKEMAVASQQPTASHFLFHTIIFTKNKMAVFPHPPFFFLFLRLKINLKGRHLNTTEVIEAESQAVLNTLTEHDFQNAFKNWQKSWESCLRAEGDCFRVTVISSLKHQSGGGAMLCEH